MKGSALVSVVAAFVIMVFDVTGALAFDRVGVLQDITAARKPLPHALSTGGKAALATPESTLSDQVARAAKEEEAAFKLLSTCEGRFGGLRKTLERQTRACSQLMES